MQITVKLVRDRELWVVSGLGWKLPVYVDPMRATGENVFDLYRVRAADCFTSDQTRELDRVLRKGALSIEKAVWFLGIEKFEKIAQKAPGVTPSAYVEWPGMDNREMLDLLRDLDEQDAADLPPDLEAFLRHVQEKTNVTNLATLKVIWQAIWREAAHWLLIRHRSIPLGLATLYPMPYRANWREILTWKFPRLGMYMRAKDEAADQLRISLIEELHRTDLLALDRKGKHIHWMIEVLHEKPWWDANSAAEEARVNLNGGKKYLVYVQQQATKAMDSAVRLLGQYCAQISLPCGTFSEGGRAECGVLRAHVPTGRVRPKGDGDGGPHFVHSLVPQMRPARPEEAVASATAAGLFPLPGVRPQMEDVRQPGQPGTEICELEDGQHRTDGLPVLLPDQGDGAGGDLLAAQPGNGGGVAE